MHAQVLTWNSHSVDERISETMSSVRELDELLKRIKKSERRAHELAAEWSAHSLFERREGQVRSILISTQSHNHSHNPLVMIEEREKR